MSSISSLVDDKVAVVAVDRAVVLHDGHGGRRGGHFCLAHSLFLYRVTHQVRQNLSLTLI